MEIWKFEEEDEKKREGDGVVGEDAEKEEEED